MYYYNLVVAEINYYIILYIWYLSSRSDHTTISFIEIPPSFYLNKPYYHNNKSILLIHNNLMSISLCTVSPTEVE